MQPDVERFFPQSADTVENLRQNQNAACGHVGTQRRTCGLCMGMSQTASQRRKELYGLLGKTFCQSWKKKTRAVCRSEMRRGVGYRVGRRTLRDRAGAVEKSRLHPKAYLFFRTRAGGGLSLQCAVFGEGAAADRLGEKFKGRTCGSRAAGTG